LKWKVGYPVSTTFGDQNIGRQIVFVGGPEFTHVRSARPDELLPLILLQPTVSGTVRNIWTKFSSRCRRSFYTKT